MAALGFNAHIIDLTGDDSSRASSDSLLKGSSRSSTPTGLRQSKKLKSGQQHPLATRHVPATVDPGLSPSLPISRVPNTTPLLQREPSGLQLAIDKGIREGRRLSEAAMVSIIGSDSSGSRTPSAPPVIKAGSQPRAISHTRIPLPSERSLAAGIKRSRDGTVKVPSSLQQGRSVSTSTTEQPLAGASDKYMSPYAPDAALRDKELPHAGESSEKARMPVGDLDSVGREPRRLSIADTTALEDSAPGSRFQTLAEKAMRARAPMLASGSPSKKFGGRSSGLPYTPEQDARLIYMHEVLRLPWASIIIHFPGRSKGTLSTRLSRREAHKNADRLGTVERARIVQEMESSNNRPPIVGAPLKSRRTARATEYEEKPSTHTTMPGVEQWLASTPAVAGIPTPPEEPAVLPQVRRRGRPPRVHQPSPVTLAESTSHKTIPLRLQRPSLLLLRLQEERDAALFGSKDHVSTARSYLPGQIASRFRADPSILDWDIHKLPSWAGTILQVDAGSALRLGSQSTSTAALRSGLRSVASLTRQREFGYRERGRTHFHAEKPLLRAETNTVFDSLGPSISYTGMSNDLNMVAWAPDGLSFAAGSSCHMDTSSMQYNRPNNLLVGNVVNKDLLELPDHHVAREEVRPETGVNASHSMHVSQDPRLFTTVSSVAFSPDGRHLYTAGYDGALRVWPTDRLKKPFPTIDSECEEPRWPQFSFSLKHKAEVDLLAVSKTGMVATGARRVRKAVKLLRWDDSALAVLRSYASEKAKKFPDLKLYPSALRFDPYTGDHLAAGFSANLDDGGMDAQGEACLWNVERNITIPVYGAGRNVFDIAWNPARLRSPALAIACKPSGAANRGTRSTVRLQDLRLKQNSNEPHMGLVCELECPALDINDVVYCPYDDSYIATGCTDGKVYIWDIRNHDEILHTFSHGRPLAEMSADLPREVFDEGIRFLSWGHDTTRLYSGSSDGVVKTWDMTRDTEDAFIKDVVSLNSGVMCGSFCPDFSSLLIGEVNGSITTLEVGCEDRKLRNIEKYTLHAAPVSHSQIEETDMQDKESGIAEARRLLNKGELVTRPMGALPLRQVVQGPAYSGPFDNAPDAATLRRKAQDFQDSLLAPSTSAQCDIEGCADGIARLTCEDVSDSGRSADRIPDTLRWLKLFEDTGFSAAKVKCTNCGRPARLKTGQDSEREQARACELCSFACFRCGPSLYHAKTSPYLSEDLNSVYCHRCHWQWRIGSLGYTGVAIPFPLEKTMYPESHPCTQDSVPGFSERLSCPRCAGLVTDLEERATHGHCSNCSLIFRKDMPDLEGYGPTEDLIEFYHSRWTDTPPVP